jgi:hypothetical protein
MVLKETQLVITSGNATSANFDSGAEQGIRLGTQNVRFPPTSGNQTNPAFIPRPLPLLNTNTSGMGTPIGTANNFQVMLPQPFENVVKTEVRYFFMENGISNVYESSASTIYSLFPDGNNTFFIRKNYDPNDNTAGVQYKIVIPPGYYDRNALANVILNLVNQLDPNQLVDGAVISTPSQTSSNPIYNNTLVSGTVTPATNFSACTIGSDGVFRLELDTVTSPFSTTSNFCISFVDRLSNQSYNYTQYLLGFQDIYPPQGFTPAQTEFQGVTTNNVTMVSSPNSTTIDIYNYILIQSQKLGSRVVSTTGVNAYCIIPMSGLNTQIASQTGQFSYDGGNFTLDANYFDFPRRLDVIDIRLADSTGALLDIGTNTVTLVIRIIQSVV